MAKTQTTEVMARIARNREIRARIDEVTLAISRSQPASMIAIPFEEARTRLQSFVNMHGGGNETSVPEARRLELSALKNSVEKGRSDLRELNEKDTDLRAELAALKDELATIPCCVDRKEIVALQSKIDEIMGDLAILDRTIAEQQGVIEANPARSLDSLYRNREELLADSAVGKDVVKELETLGKEIKNKEAGNAVAAKNRDEAEQAITALFRRRDTALLRLEELEADRKDIAVFYLKSEADTVSGEYRESAGEIAGIYARLRALDMLLLERGEDTLLGRDAVLFRIPSLGPGLVSAPPVFDARTENPAAWVEEEKKRLEGSGLKI